MLKEITLKEAEGKVLKTHYSFVWEPKLILIFTDGTFTTLGADVSFEEGTSIGQDTLDLDPAFFNDAAELIELGVVTEEELKVIQEEGVKKDEAARAEREWEEYKRLAEKFKGGIRV